MKKMLAMAIAASLAAPAALMADTTLYGQLHTSLDSLESDTTDSALTTLVGNSSRLGVKGKEKISDSMSAIYAIEWGVDITGDGGGLSNRHRYVGLKGNWGAVKLGRMSTPYKVIGRKADLFWSSQLGQNRNLLNNQEGYTANMISYSSPKMGGFSYTVAHATEANDNSANTAWSANAMYSNGGIMVGAGWLKADEATGGSEQDYRLMGSYDTGKAKFVLFYENESDVDGTDGDDRDTWGIGASMKTANGVVKGQYYSRSELGDDDDGADMFAIGYDHNLSKRTTIYAQYAQVGNDTAGVYDLGGNGHGPSTFAVETGAGDDVTGLSLGIRHKF